MEKMPLSKLNGHKIYNSVAKGLSTLRRLAESYDCSFEQFLAECKRKISPFEWKRILKADAKNQKLEVRRKVETNMKTTSKVPQPDKARKKQALLGELAIIQEKADVSKRVTADFEGRVAEAEKAEAQAKRDWEQAQQRLTWATQNLADSRKTDAKYDERIRQIQNQLAEFDIYLVAPGYKGEIPKGKLVSVVPFDGYNVTVEKGDDLLNDVSFADMMELGFETLKEVDVALEFAKLVLKYQLEYEGDFEILVDDQKVITILKGQEVDI